MLIFLGVMMFMYQFIVRIFFLFAVNDIKLIYGVSYDFIGIVAGIYYTGYAISNLFTAVLFARYNFIYITTIGSMLVTIGLGLFAVDGPSGFVMLGRLLIGMGSGMAMPFLMQIIFRFYDKTMHEVLINTSFMLVTFGVSLMVYICELFYNITIDYYDLIHILLFSGFIHTGILIIACFYFASRQDDLYVNNNILHDIFNFFFNKKILILGIVGGLFVGSLEGFADLWALYFFREVYGIENASISVSVFWMCLAISPFVLQFLYNNLTMTNMMFLAIIGFVKILVFVTMLGSVYMNINVTLNMTIIIMVILGIGSGYQFFLFNQVSSIVGVEYAVLGVSIINSINMLFGQFFHFVISSVFAMNKTGQLTGIDYMYGLSIMPICFVIGILLIARYYSYLTAKNVK
ncbi:MAG: MFS transporter [Pseudomonadota bacterium]